MLPKTTIEATRRIHEARMKHLVANASMTDHHILRNAFDILNIDYVETRLAPSEYIQLILKEGMENTEGYQGFYTEFLFDDQGTFLTCGAYGV